MSYSTWIALSRLSQVPATRVTLLSSKPERYANNGGRWNVAELGEPPKKDNLVARWHSGIPQGDMDSVEIVSKRLTVLRLKKINRKDKPTGIRLNTHGFMSVWRPEETHNCRNLFRKRHKSKLNESFFNCDVYLIIRLS